MENQPYPSTSIPESLEAFFQEYDLATLSIPEDANLIIQRTLEFGNWDEVRWLFQVYGAERIRKFLRKLGERKLKTANFQLLAQVTAHPQVDTLAP